MTGTFSTAERSYPSQRSGAAAGRSYPTPEARGGSQEEQPEERCLRRHRRAYRSYPTLKIRNGGGKEIPLIQGKEQLLCFAGVAVKRYPKSKVRKFQVRW